MADKPNKLRDSYAEGECPDCGWPIPHNVREGDECQNCGHVFWLPKNGNKEERNAS
jgi:hypothetical protein